MTTNFLQTFFQQPDHLPPEVQAAAQRAIGAERIQAFAMSDLDARLQFSQSWLVLSDAQVLLLQPDGAWQNGSTTWQTRAFALGAIEKFELFPGLSSSRLHIVGAEKKLLASVQFTRRQSRTVGNLQFIAEQLRERLKSGKPPLALAGEVDSQKEYRNAMLESAEEAKAALAVPKTGVMLRLATYLKPHRKEVTIGVTLAWVLTLLQLLPPYLTGVLIDKILRPAESGQIANPWFWLWVIIGSLAVVWSTAELVSFFRLRIMAITGEKIATQLREQIYAHMQKLSLSFFASRSTGSLITRISSDTDRLWDFITFGIIEIVVSVLQIIGIAVALLFMDISLAGLVLLPLPLMTWLFYRHSKKIQVLFLRIWRK
ncbi:MAG: ABC transporter transmembrane domain-containing protein, partial [candidate division KSB1 bacterium]